MRESDVLTGCSPVTFHLYLSYAGYYNTDNTYTPCCQTVTSLAPPNLPRHHFPDPVSETLVPGDLPVRILRLLNILIIIPGHMPIV